MIGVIFALALQATDTPQAPPANSPTIGDLIGDILAQTAPNAPPAPVPPRTAPQIDPPQSTPAPSVPAAPPDARASRYESSLRSSFQAQEARQGDLDGRWAVSGADGQTLYMLQLADPGPGRGPVEGAWRDLVRASASGFIDAADRTARTLTLTFQDAGPCTLTLTLGPDGRWSGQIKTAAQSRPVTMARP